MSQASHAHCCSLSRLLAGTRSCRGRRGQRFAAHSFAVVAYGLGDSELGRGENVRQSRFWTLAATDSTDEFESVLALAVGDAARGPALLAELATPSTWRTRLLPPWQRALARSREEIEIGARAPDAPPRTPANILWRARQLLLAEAVIAALQGGGGGTGVRTGSIWSKALRRAHVAISTPTDERAPSPRDYAAMVEAAGWRRLPKQESGYPFLRPPAPAGHVPLVDVAALVRAYEEDEKLPDDAVEWTVFAHLFSHEIQLDQRDKHGLTLQERVERSIGPIRFSPAAPEGPDIVKFQSVIEKWRERGVLEGPLTDEQINDKGYCAAISQLKPVVKGPLRMSDEAEAAIAADDLVALAVAAARASAELMAEFERDLTTQSQRSPVELLDELLARHKEPAEASWRMCFNGHALGEYTHDFSFRYVSLDEFLEKVRKGDVVAKNDASAFFYHGKLSPESARFVCCEYRGKVYRYLRWTMGAKDSPGLASLLSGLICDIVARRAAHDLDAYVDDFMIAGEPEAADHTQKTLVETMAEVSVEESVAKRVTPDPSAELLGRLVDVPTGRVSMKLSKLYQYQCHAFFVRLLLCHTNARARAAVTKVSLAKLTGRLMWLAAATISGRCHLSGLISGGRSSVEIEHLRKLVVRDLSWWCDGWLAGTIAPEALLPAAELHDFVQIRSGRDDAVRSDAGEPGGGAVYGTRALHRVWTAEEKTDSSDRLEAAVILDCMRTWGPEWRGRHVVLLTDNYGNIFSMMKGRAAGRPVVQSIIEDMYAVAERLGFRFSVVWIPREANMKADALSKCPTANDAAACCGRLGLTLEAVRSPDETMLT